jgi:hypothetical protein
MRFQPAEPVQLPSRGFESRPTQGSPQPLALSPATSSLSNRRPSPAFSSSQRSWSPMNWGSTSSPSSQPSMHTSQWPPQRLYPVTASPTLKSVSPGPGQGQSLHNQLLQSNLFISQDMARASEPPHPWQSQTSSARLGETSSSLFFHRGSVSTEDSAVGQENRGASSLQGFGDPLQIRPASATSDRLSQGRPEVDDYTSLMPPPRQLPFASSKKPKTTLEAGKTETTPATSHKPPGTSKSTTTRPSVSLNNPQHQPAGDPAPQDRTASASRSTGRAPVFSTPQPPEAIKATATKHAAKKPRRSLSGAKSGRSKRQRKDLDTGVDKEQDIGTATTRTTPENRGSALALYQDAEVQVNRNEPSLQPLAGSCSTSGLGKSEQLKKTHTSPTATNNPPDPPRRPGLRSSKLQDDASAAAEVEMTTDHGVGEITKRFRHAKTQTKVSTRNRGASCNLRPSQASSGTQAGTLLVSTGTSCDAVPASHQTTQTDTVLQQDQPSPRSRYVDSDSQTHAAATINAGNGCDIRTLQSTTATQTERHGVETGTQTESKTTPSDTASYLSSDLIVGAFRSISDARDLMHHHVDGDLDQMEHGSHVDIAQSMGEMLHAVEGLAQRALDDHGAAMLEIPFALMARDYLRNREANVEI